MDVLAGIRELRFGTIGRGVLWDVIPNPYDMMRLTSIMWIHSVGLLGGAQRSIKVGCFVLTVRRWQLLAQLQPVDQGEITCTIVCEQDPDWPALNLI